MRPVSSKLSASVPVGDIASVTRKMWPGPRLARSATPSEASVTWMPSAMSPAPERAQIERRADHAGIAIAELALRVEQMRDHRRAGFGRGAHNGVGRIGVADADDDAGLVQARDLVGRHRFGGDGDEEVGSACRASTSASRSASSIGRISAGSCAPLRATLRCGPSR